VLWAEAGIVTASALSGFQDTSRNCLKEWDEMAGGELRHFAECRWGGVFWHWVSDTRCQFGGDNLGAVVEEQNGGCPRTHDWMVSGRQQGAAIPNRICNALDWGWRC